MTDETAFFDKERDRLATDIASVSSSNPFILRVLTAHQGL